MAGGGGSLPKEKGGEKDLKERARGPWGALWDNKCTSCDYDGDAKCCQVMGLTETGKLRQGF